MNHRRTNGATHPFRRTTACLSTTGWPRAGVQEKVKKQKWPAALSDQAAAVHAALAAIGEPADAALVAKRFTRGNKQRIEELLEALESLGKARQLDDGRYVGIA